MKGKTIVTLVSSGLLAITGFAGGVYLTILLGLARHADWGYYLYEDVLWSPAGFVGIGLPLGCSFLGAAVPWLIRRRATR